MTRSNEKSAVAAETHPVGKVPLPMYCQCLADPEATSACRIPDEHVSPTNAQKLVEEFILSSDAAGDLFHSVVPGLATSRRSHTVTGGVTSATATSIAHPDSVETLAAFDYGRLVVYQVTITYIGNRQSASGRLVTVSESNLAYGFGQALTTLFDDGESRAAVDGAIVIVRPRAKQGFENIASTNMGIPAFNVVYIGASGLPLSSPVFSVRITKHFELVPKRSSVWRGSATAELYHPTIMAMATNMGEVGTVGPRSAAKSLKNEAMAAANYAWNYVKPEIAQAGKAILTTASVAAKDALLALM